MPGEAVQHGAVGSVDEQHALAREHDQRAVTTSGVAVEAILGVLRQRNRTAQARVRHQRCDTRAGILGDEKTYECVSVGTQTLCAHNMHRKEGDGQCCGVQLHVY